MLKQYTGFDHENVLKPGTPIRVTNTKNAVTFYALIIKSNEIEVVVTRHRDYQSELLCIHLSDVQSGYYKIELLSFEEVK